MWIGKLSDRLRFMPVAVCQNVMIATTKPKQPEARGVPPVLQYWLWRERQGVHSVSSAAIPLGPERFPFCGLHVGQINHIERHCFDIDLVGQFDSFGPTEYAKSTTAAEVPSRKKARDRARAVYCRQHRSRKFGISVRTIRLNQLRTPAPPWRGIGGC